MKLFYEPSATTCRPVMLFAADHKIELDYQHVRLFEGEHLTDAFAAINPNRSVPVLLDDDFTLTEVSAILKYLADQVGSLAYPKTVRERARVNESMDWFNTGLYRDFGYGLVYPQVLPDYTYPTAAQQASFDRFASRSARWLDILDAQLGNHGPFVLGSDITLADYLGSCYVTLGDLINFDFSSWKHVDAWIAAMRARPTWNEVNAAFYGWSSATRAQAA